jgi:hypothetical protein
MTESKRGAAQPITASSRESVGAAGCAGEGSIDPAGPEPAPTELVRLAGEGQTGLTGAPLPDSLVVRVLDGDGDPLGGVSVDWRLEGGGELRPARTTTARDGTARTLWVLGTQEGPRSARAVVEDMETTFTAVAGAAEPGAIHEGRAGYVAYEAGALPLILSAGHGGTLEPGEIPDRTEGTLARDLDTDRLAVVMADSIEARLGARPHVVVSRLHRRKLDPNRDLPEATQGNALAEHAWREYHGFLEHARTRLEGEHGVGFYIDVHGHGHETARLELGYLLTGTQLEGSDEDLDDGATAAGSSIRALADASPLPFSALIRGESSLGTLFEDAGVPAVPGARQPDPGGAPFFSGGYSTRRHGSRDGGTVSGVQIEAHREGVRDTEENRARFAGAAASVLEAYFTTHYDGVFE